MSPTIRRLTTFSVLSLLVIALTAAAQSEPTREDAARAAASEWLALVDSGKYGESWQQASRFFRNAVTREQWERSLHAVRDPLGRLLSRKPISATYSKTLPGAPDGEYVVIRYESSFEHKRSAIETVTTMLDWDGNWRVSGYFIK
jgi:hypothetical protein